MEKILNLLDITRAGTEVPLADIGRAQAPLVYARAGGESDLTLAAPVFLNRPAFAPVFPPGPSRRGEDLICAVRDCFYWGPSARWCCPRARCCANRS